MGHRGRLAELGLGPGLQVDGHPEIAGDDWAGMRRRRSSMVVGSQVQVQNGGREVGWYRGTEFSRQKADNCTHLGVGERVGGGRALRARAKGCWQGGSRVRSFQWCHSQGARGGVTGT